jgi:hypothetical protein
MTSANTTYYQLQKEDVDFLIEKAIQVQSYMGEISLSKSRDIRDLVKWYSSSNKSLPYSSNFKRHNSPQSFISGILNNFLYNGQKDITDLQSSHIENILAVFTQLQDAIDIQLQKSANNDSVIFLEDLWEVSK